QNLAAAHQTRTEFWVNFRVFWLFGLTVVFSVGQFFYLLRYLKDQPE
ncbi:MAG: septation protein IspZ, partial [Gammaproteobacteria bacterium]|nr:septation protein IspZ [Gammaproteobacteria bacterium]